MRRRLLDFIIRFTAWLRRGQRVRPGASPVKVNLGSGLNVAAGWINIDASLNALFSKTPAAILKRLYRISGARQFYTEERYLHILRNHTFVHHRMEYGLPFEDEAVDYLYTSHMLEHLFRDDSEKLLKEAYRVLKPNGRIRVCVPDLEYAIKLYHANDKAKALEFFFSSSRSGVLDRHQYMYDSDLLTELLERAGFIDVQQCDYRQGQTPDIDRLDNRPEQTLFLEARK